MGIDIGYTFGPSEDDFECHRIPSYIKGTYFTSMKFDQEYSKEEAICILKNDVQKLYLKKRELEDQFRASSRMLSAVSHKIESWKGHDPRDLLIKVKSLIVRSNDLLTCVTDMDNCHLALEFFEKELKYMVTLRPDVRIEMG